MKLTLFLLIPHNTLWIALLHPYFVIAHFRLLPWLGCELLEDSGHVLLIPLILSAQHNASMLWVLSKY